MSEMEFRIGKVEEIAKEFGDIENKLIFAYNTGLLNKNQLEEYQEDGWLDSETLIISNGKLFQVIDDKDIEDESNLLEVESIGNNEYSFKLRYYNGSTCFSEMLRGGLNKFK